MSDYCYYALRNLPIIINTEVCTRVDEQPSPTRAIPCSAGQGRARKMSKKNPKYEERKRETIKRNPKYEEREREKKNLMYFLTPPTVHELSLSGSRNTNFFQYSIMSGDYRFPVCRVRAYAYVYKKNHPIMNTDFFFLLMYLEYIRVDFKKKKKRYSSTKIYFQIHFLCTEFFFFNTVFNY